MNHPERGRKHLCPKCAIKYYDLGRKSINCPQCGGKPAEAQLSRATYTTKKAGARAFKKSA